MAVQLSNEQFERLIAKIGTATSPPKPTPGSFTTCKYSYNGNKSSEVVEAFLAAINIFKHSEKISDEIALEQIPLLLKEDAGVWWQGAKATVKSWEEFEKRLRDNFSPKKEAYLIYTELLQKNQGPGETTEDFIRHKRLLFSQLPEPSHPETQQLDMIYGLLSLKIRDKAPRWAPKL